MGLTLDCEIRNDDTTGLQKFRIRNIGDGFDYHTLVGDAPLLVLHCPCISRLCILRSITLA
jgi:hypothetical protein